MQAIDLRSELCSGCRLCELVCGFSLFGELNPSKAALRVHGYFPQPGGFGLVICDQCGECAEVCPVGCITKKDGQYRLDAVECTGCGACVSACPRGAIFEHKALVVPIKCDGCQECVRMCPRQALFVKEVGSGARTIPCDAREA